VHGPALEDDLERLAIQLEDAVRELQQIYESGRGFVSNSRFGSGQVIPRTNREVSRKWRAGVK
jgi:hypothetical protein